MTGSAREELEAALVEAVAALRGGRRVVVFTGSGVSAESGVPTFRDAMTGLWARFDPEALATPEAFDRDPALVSRWYDERRCAAAACEPNGAHRAIASLQARVRALGGSCVVVTQNVDGLHQRAGSTDAIELHGSLFRWRSRRTGRVASPEEMPMPLASYPAFDASGEVLRPGVVWFGEALPRRALEEADRASGEADVFLSVGTSAVVYPAAGLIRTASEAGATVIEVNPSVTPSSRLARVCLRVPAGEVLPGLIARAFGVGV